jgi:hypothetical protein
MKVHSSLLNVVLHDWHDAMTITDVDGVTDSIARR